MGSKLSTQRKFHVKIPRTTAVTWCQVQLLSARRTKVRSLAGLQHETKQQLLRSLCAIDEAMIKSSRPRPRKDLATFLMAKPEQSPAQKVIPNNVDAMGFLSGSLSLCGALRPEDRQDVVLGLWVQAVSKIVSDSQGFSGRAGGNLWTLGFGTLAVDGALRVLLDPEARDTETPM